MNRKAVEAADAIEDNHNRHCSFSGDAKNGVVLHSAKLRNTVFLYPLQAKRFLVKWFSVNSQEARDSIVESYFV
jgi:hypothetical protein